MLTPLCWVVEIRLHRLQKPVILTIWIFIISKSMPVPSQGLALIKHNKAFCPVLSDK
jgi:hypothetical protein